ncbi:MAG TPA: hypothetical protein VN764_12715, partial [Polyangiaceae bacterium]|nr:hypothetical protein [Polyangiaceae bacterium]
GAAHPLLTPTLRARVALCLELPVDSEVNVAPLALTLTTRNATHRDWIEVPSTGALPSRRMAALLYEHAAREAVFRFQLGDPHPRNLLIGERTGAAWRLLLADREPLVWQHAAIARGLLGAISTEIKQEVEQSLDPALGVTEWRRGAVSLVASTVLGDEEAHRSVISVLQSPLMDKDRGLAAAMVSGLARVVEMEPEIAESVLDHLADLKRPDVALAWADLIGRIHNQEFAVRARLSLHSTLVEHGKSQSKAERSLVSRGLRALSMEREQEVDLSTRVAQALQHFESVGAAAAYQAALHALGEAHELAAFVEASPIDDAQALGPLVASLAELDQGALSGATLHHLLLLGRGPGDSGRTVESFDRLHNRVSRCLLDGLERAGKLEWNRDIALVDQRRLLVVLHLVDAELGNSTDIERKETHLRLQRALRLLLKRLGDGPDAMLHRVLCAALARSMDAAVRQGVVQASDLFLVVASTLTDNYSVKVIAEASTLPEVAQPLTALAEFMNVGGADALDSESAPGWSLPIAASDHMTVADALRKIARLRALNRGLGGEAGYHAESLRRIFFRLGRALERVATARGQVELVQARDTGAPVLEDLRTACEDLVHMVRNAERRVLASLRSIPAPNEDIGLYELVEHGMESEKPP